MAGLVASLSPNTRICQRSGGAPARALQVWPCVVMPCFRPHSPAGVGGL